MDIDGERQTSIGKWIEDLIARAKKTLIAGENLNAFYLPDFIDRFAGVAKEFPLWTAVGMPPDTRRATSSYVEGYFNDLKTRVLKQYSLPISVDKFMREHANDIAGANCIISAAMVQYNNDRLHSNNTEVTNEIESAPVKVRKEFPFQAAEIELVENVSYFVDLPSETVEDEKDSDLIAVENWRGKGDELELKNLWMNANPCESDNNNNHADLTFDIDIDITNEDAGKSHSEHSYCKVSRLAESHQDLTYRNFESALNQRVSLSSSITETVTQLLSEQPEKTSKYFKPFSEIRQNNALITDKKRNHVKNAELLLPNGSISPAVVMEGRTYGVRHTCSFDSVVQILATAAIDNVEYHQFLENDTNRTLQFVISLITQGVSKNLLIERARILSSLCPPKPEGVIMNKPISWCIDAWHNVARVVQYTLSSNPSVVDTEECSVCGVRTIPRITIAPSHKILFKKGFKALEEALGFWSPYFNILCRNGCPGKFTRTSTLNNHILMELDIRHPEDAKKSLKCKLEDFPKTLKLRSESAITEFRLAGIVELLPAHYIAHCWRIGGFWQRFNDMDKKPGKSSSKTLIKPQLAIYTRNVKEL